MSTPSILVSGASIAGPAAASWLAAGGWDVTVVERFDHAAFARSERLLRPLTDHAQEFVPRAMYPRVESHRLLLQATLRVAGSPVGSVLSRIPALYPTPPVSAIALPDYSMRALPGAQGPRKLAQR